MKHARIILIMLIVFFFVVLSLTSINAASDPPSKIRFGHVSAMSGWLSADTAITQWPNYRLWAEDVNAKGGIYVKEFGKRLPVELVYYDDKSDPATTAKMYEKLILQDKVDFLLAPFGTAWHFAAAPIANKYGYQMIGVTVSSNPLVKKAQSGDLPYYFTDWAPPSYQAPYLVDLLVELGVKTVSFIYISTLYGIEYAGTMGPLFAVAGIQVPIMKSYPTDIMDFSPLLKEIKAANNDALVAVAYGVDGTLLIEQMKTIDLNPKAFWCAASSWSSPQFIEKFSKKGLEGVMGEGVMNPNLPYPGLKEYWDRFVKKWGREPDYANSPHVYTTLQVYEQAIEKAGTLDRKKVRDVMATEEFTTITGTFRFINNYRESQPGMVGQWQDNNFEVVAPKDKRTANVLYPKPPWPK